MKYFFKPFEIFLSISLKDADFFKREEWRSCGHKTFCATGHMVGKVTESMK